MKRINQKTGINLVLIFQVFFLLAPLSDAASGAAYFPGLNGRSSTMNFIVWAPTQRAAEAVSAGLEDYYNRFLGDLECGGMLKKKPNVYIFASAQDYLDNLNKIGYNAANTGGIAIPRSARKPAEIYSFLNGNLLDEVLPHEITHLLFKEVIAGLKVDARMPLWLDEGMASYEEKSERYRARVKQAMESGALMSAAEITSCTSYPADLAKRGLFYAESASIVGFLLSEYGGAKFTSFSRKLVLGGKNVDEALFSTYYPQLKNVSQLDDAWRKFLKK